MKKRLTTAFLIFLFLAGVSLLLYPTVSNHWNALHASAAVTAYAEQVQGLDRSQYNAILAAAREYNRSLLGRENVYVLSQDQKEQYESILNLDGTGIMGSIEIPSIHVSLPIYHGTSDAVLQVGAGHLEWTSLPVGGEGTHCVLSGHSGLPGARLFTDLHKLAVGDTFVLRVLNETLIYVITDIRTVEPTDTEALTIREGADLCTLVTCTPYGINTHRLLICGQRTENAIPEKSLRVISDAACIESSDRCPGGSRDTAPAGDPAADRRQKRRDRNEM